MAGTRTLDVSAGDVSVIAGTWLGLTVIFTGAEVVRAVRLSVAFAVSVKLPAGTSVHEKAYGDEVSSPNFVDPLKNSTFVTVPSLSAASAVMLIVAGARKLAPFAGAVIDTVGKIVF